MTGRDLEIIKHALHLAARGLLAEPFPHEDDARDMRRLLESLWPGSVEREAVDAHLRDGLAMGLRPPANTPLTFEEVDRWIAAEIAESDRPEFLLAEAIEEAAETAAILARCSCVRGVTDHEARERLHRAKSAIRVLSVMRVNAQPPEG